MDSGSTKKYLLYAIGEILLVMIGILLALQVNNWNEWRKDRDKEKELLQNLITNLDMNLNSFEELINLYEHRAKSSNLVLNVLENRLSYHDSLSIHFFTGVLSATAQSSFSENGYEVLKNEGISLVTNQDLRNDIVFLFEDIYERLERWADYMTDFGIESSDVWTYFLRKEFSLIPLDYSQLLENPRVYNHFQDTYFLNRRYVRFLKEASEASDRIYHLIMEELGEE
jgi:hypothetical protein